MCNSQNDKGLQKLRAAGTTRRGFLQAGAAVALSMPYLTRRSWAAEPLYVNTWGGRWEESAKKHLFDPFSKETGIEIRTVSPVSYAKLAAQARTGVYEFDVTTVGAVELVQAAEADIIEPIAGRELDTDKIPESSVFMSGLASHVFSTNICYNRDKHPDGPRSWKEFWDVGKNPGSRSMRRYAWDCLPPALMADGVTQDQIYPIDGDRAFKSLDALKEHIRVWWLQGSQAQQLIRDGEVDYIAIWHGQVQILQNQGIPLELVWNEALHSEVYWVVSKGTPRKDAAWLFAEFAASPQPLAGFCTDAVYGPMNPKSFEFIPEDMQKGMPTYPDNMKTAIHQKPELIGPDFTPLMRRFDQWIAS